MGFSEETGRRDDGFLGAKPPSSALSRPTPPSAHLERLRRVRLRRRLLSPSSSSSSLRLRLRLGLGPSSRRRRRRRSPSLPSPAPSSSSSSGSASPSSMAARASASRAAKRTARAANNAFASSRYSPRSPPSPQHLRHSGASRNRRSASSHVVFDLDARLDASSRRSKSSSARRFLRAARLAAVFAVATASPHATSILSILRPATTFSTTTFSFLTPSHVASILSILFGSRSSPKTPSGDAASSAARSAVASVCWSMTTPNSRAAASTA